MKASLRPLAFLALGAFAWPASAQCPPDTTTTADDFTCYVATTGNDLNAGTSSSPMKTIQAALDLAAGGTEYQTVRVLPGTYSDECPLTPGGVDIVSDAFLKVGTNTTTIIDGTSVCQPAGLPVVEMGDNSKLRGFTIKGGGDSGVVGFGHVTIANNIIEANLTPTYGGGVYIRTAENISGAAEEARIERNTIRNNRADFDGGGIYVDAISDGLPSKVVIDANIVQNNIAGDAGEPETIFGGGIAVFTDSFAVTDVSEVIVSGNTIDGNEAKGLAASGSFGGGVVIATVGEAHEIVEVGSSNAVRNNKATNGYGGGIAVMGRGLYAGNVAHDLLVQSNTVSANTATYGGGGIYALAWSIDLGTDEEVGVRVLSNEVSGNVSPGPADSLDVFGGGGVFAEIINGRSANGANSLTIDGNTLRNNRSESFGGGASLWISTLGEFSTPPGPSTAASTLRFANNLVTGNSVDDTQTGSSFGEGGGVYAFASGQWGGASSVDLSFNTLAHNLANSGLSGGIALDAFIIDPANNPGSTAADVSNSIFRSNSGFAVGGYAVPGIDLTALRIAFNDTYQNGAGPFAPQFAASSGPGNITDDPSLDAFFVPRLCSPTIDAGDPAEGTFVDEGGLQEERQPNGRRANLGHTGLTQNSTVTLPDATGDQLVDGLDILRLATSFAADASIPARYNPVADLDKDGDIDGSDLAYMSAWFGKACP